MLRKIILFCFLTFIFQDAFSQESNKKIYFLADTTSIPKEQRFLSIGMVTPFECVITFYCKCVSPYKDYVEFSYLITKKKPKVEIVSKKPDYTYISLKDLMDLVSKYQRHFNDSYDLYITEVLPGNHYQTNKVRMGLRPPPTTDGVILKNHN
jgi:hypothetical protein